MKLVISALEDVAEPLRMEYEPKDGKFALKLEGDYQPLVDANRKVVEFRDKNVALLKEVEELRPLKTKYDGIDPDEARVNAEKVKALGKKGVKDADDIQVAIRQGIDEALKPVKDALAQEQAEKKVANERADRLMFTTFIGTKAKAAGAQEDALEFISARASSDFEIKDGAVQPRTGKFSKEKPGDPLSVDEWLKDTALVIPFAFAPSKGGGAEGSKPGAKPATGGLKPGQTVLKNPTPQELGAAASDIAAGKVKVEFD